MGGIESRAYRVRYHGDIIADLKAIQAHSSAVATRLRVFFEEYLENDPEQRLNLGGRDFENEIMHIGPWSQMRALGYPIWRIKLQGPKPLLVPKRATDRRPRPFLRHRIPYVFDDGEKLIWMLGIFKRQDDVRDYDPTSPFGQRIRAAYDDLGLPKI